ncbi:hypothetical protein [Leucothrix pacifica]|uniref:Uncharacterized protein n=1 Tax=Leucothrix pacifica TaxID=1247513 RepID=A0A317CGN7_9GAMM|nr:hypothetical protein [Leucothrix pacifica]PWQ97686.1 hypothetical protein DKW60_09930 [Leucothrix pacifica]
MDKVTEITLKSDDKPTVKIKAVQVVFYMAKPSERWCIYKIKRGADAAGYLYLVAGVYNQGSQEILEPEQYKHYHEIVSSPINDKELISLIGIEHEDERGVLDALGIDWERLTLIEYGSD